MERFEGAFRMTYRRNTKPGNNKNSKFKLVIADKQMKKPTRKDLVYLEDSPNYCERNQT